MASVKSSIRYAVKEDHRFICQFCFKKFPAEKLQIHHILPRSLGGNNHYTNLLPLCGGNDTNNCHLFIHRYNITHNRKKQRVLFTESQTVTFQYPQINIFIIGDFK